MLSADAIQAIARDLMAELGAGYAEGIYRNALYTELVRLDPKTVMERSVPIVFRGQYLGMCRADIVTTDFVLEIKARFWGTDKPAYHGSRSTLQA